MLLGWSYRDRKWSESILKEIAASRSTLTRDAVLGQDAMVDLLTKLNALIFADGSTRISLLESAKATAENGISNASEAISRFGQILSASVYLGLIDNWDAADSKRLLTVFDESRSALSKLSPSSSEDVATLAFSALPMLLLFEPNHLGEFHRLKLLHAVIQQGDTDVIQEVANYLAHWVNSKGFLTAFQKGESSDEAARGWNTVDALYLAANYGSYASYAARSRQQQALYALKSRSASAEKQWQMYYEVAQRYAHGEPDQALAIAVEALAALDKNDGTSRLPTLPDKWRDEFQIRFGSLVGSILTKRHDFVGAIKALKPAADLAVKSGCFWLARGEKCIAEQHPGSLTLWDDLAEVSLAVGDVDQAKEFVGRAEDYRGELKKQPGFKGFDSNIIRSAKTRAGCLLSGTGDEPSRGLKIVQLTSDTVAKQLWPRRPSRQMFQIVMNGQTVDLIERLPEKPEWDVQISKFNEAIQRASK